MFHDFSVICFGKLCALVKATLGKFDGDVEGLFADLILLPILNMINLVDAVEHVGVNFAGCQGFGFGVCIFP